MEILREPRLQIRLLLLLLLASLLGLSPRSHLAAQEMHQAQQAIQSGAFDQASGHVAVAAGQTPDNASLWELAGHYALQSGQARSAVDYFREADLESLSPEGRLELGEAYRQIGDLPAAVRTWQAALSLRDPAAGHLYQLLLEAHLAQSDYPAAIQDLKVLSGQRPGDARLQYRLGLLLATQTPELALVYLQQAEELDPSLSTNIEALRRSIQAARLVDDPAYTLLAAGRSLAASGEWPFAAEAFHQSTLARPDYAEAWAYLGEARQHLPQGGEGALEDFEKALKLDPNSLATHSFLALYWERQERYDLSQPALERAVELDANNPALLAELGNLQALNGDLGAALASFRQAVAHAPLDLDYLSLLAGFSLKYEYQVRQVALPAARLAVRLAPEDPHALDLMAQVLLKLGDQVSAGRFLDRALQADARFAPAHMHLGLLYLMEAHTTQALDEFNLARSLDPGGPVASQTGRLLQTYFP